MSLFCLLWTPLFYLYWRSISPAGESGAGGIWALLLGSFFALFQFFLGAMVSPGGFGFSRWLSGCIDVITLPALLPLLAYLALIGFRVISGNADFTGFALLWIIPMGALRAVSWGAQGDPILLVLAPLLWTAIAGGIPFLGALFIDGSILVRIPLALAILVLPFLAGTAYWAFFCQKLTLGFPLLLLSLAPILVGSILGAVRSA
jgi:hypothetical protein